MTRTIKLKLTVTQHKSLKALALRQGSTIEEAIGVALNTYWRKLGRPKNAVFAVPAWMTQLKVK